MRRRSSIRDNLIEGLNVTQLKKLNQMALDPSTMKLLDELKIKLSREEIFAKKFEG